MTPPTGVPTSSGVGDAIPLVSGDAAHEKYLSQKSNTNGNSTTTTWGKEADKIILRRSSFADVYKRWRFFHTCANIVDNFSFTLDANIFVNAISDQSFSHNDLV
jgi:hypothetical protein